MDPKVLEWLKALLEAQGYALVKRSQVKTLRATATMDRTVLEDCDSTWELKRLVDEILVERLADTIMKAPWCARREQEALTDGTSTRFNLELIVLEDECRVLTTTP